MTGKTKQLLIMSPTWLGDAIMALPAIREAGRVFDDHRLTILCREGLKELFELDMAIDGIWLDTGDRAMAARGALASDRIPVWNAALLLQNSFRSAWRAWRLGAKERIGFRTDGRGWLLTYPIERPSGRDRRHQVYYYLELIAGIERKLRGESRVDFDRPDISLYAKASQQSAASELLERMGLAATGGFFVINPGATNSRAKQWLPDRFAAVADRIFDETGMMAVIVGTAGDRCAADAVLERALRPIIDLTGRTGLGELIGVVSLARLLITNDTGTSHLGGALGIPTLTIFGPTQSFATRPFAEQAVVIEKPVSCAPCMLRDCPIDHRCMTGVQVDDVLEAARSVLQIQGRFVG
ncbi:MAG: lipopolysaccharide heptosyltransferase II [Acidobacteria bacterium]|nr:lipopolysaccharide heptosyltransferase II [Acidobacteriota bacterium]